jgi:hypothetical protein
MSESEETKWRLGTEPEEAEERAAELSSEEDEKKEELQQTVQTKVEEIGSGGEGTLITRPKEVTEAPRKKAKRPSVREPNSNKGMVNISKQLERQATQLARIEKVVVNRIDKQSNTIKQLYAFVTQLQKQIHSTKNRKQNQGVQKKKREKNPTSSRSKKRSPKRRR